MIIKKKTIVLLLGIGGLLGVLVLVSGIIPVGASGGHWKVTETILHFAMERSISIRGLGVEAPKLDKEWNVIKGAGHFEIGCRQCHGIPGNPGTNFLGTLMTARAPYLPPLMDKWKPEELFQIVKHGVKFTGMPQWPALERDDEVWSMVAFLKEVPEMSEAEYKKMVFVEAGIQDKTLQTCLNCHGSDGLGRGVGAFPKLAGQRYEYMKRSLEEYKSGIRKSASMRLIASSLDESKLAELSRYFSELPIKQKKHSSKSISIERGRLIAENGIPAQGVAACVRCHGPKNIEANNQQYPKLDGQYSEYIKLQLHQILFTKRSKSKFETIMKKAVRTLTKEQIEDVAHYYESL